MEWLGLVALSISIYAGIYTRIYVGMGRKRWFDAYRLKYWLIFSKRNDTLYE